MSNSISAKTVTLSENSINKIMKLDNDKSNNITVSEIKSKVQVKKDGNLSDESLINLGITDKKDIDKISKEYTKHKDNPLAIVFNDSRYEVDKNPKSVDLSKVNDFISSISKLVDKNLSKDEVYELKNSVKNMSGFSKNWCKEVIKIISENKSEAKQFIIQLKKNVDVEVLKKALVLAHTDPILNSFKGEKKETFKKFLESYYSDPVLLLGLKQASQNSFVSGSIKNFEQSVKMDTKDGIKPNSFGSCQDIQRRVSIIMKSEKNFSNFFDIEDHPQLFGLHNYVLVTDKETKQIYQADPWYYQTLKGSIQKKDSIH